MNPYAPPLHDEEPGFGGNRVMGREGSSLVIPVTGAVLPKRCVSCNQPATTRVQGSLYWHPPWLYALVFLCFVAYLVLVLLVNKKAAFEYWLCEQHGARRHRGRLIGWLGIPSALLGLVFVRGWWLLLDCAVLVGMAATSIVLTTAVSARRIDSQHAWLKVGPRFLESFPTLPVPAPRA
jgi:hypothetical protein